MTSKPTFGILLKSYDASEVLLYLLLSVACSVGVYLVFRIASDRHLEQIWVVAWNYPVCALLGGVVLWTQNGITPLPVQPWLWIAVLVLGGMFIGMFWVAGKHTQLFGAGATALVSRLSLVIPVTYSAWVYHDPFHWNHALGIALALAAIYLHTMSASKRIDFRPVVRWSGLPLLLFIGFGINDVIVKTVQQEQLADTSGLFFVSMVFTASMGWSIPLLFTRENRSREVWKPAWGPGMLLGFFNFGGFYFFVRALQDPRLPGTSIFPLNSVLIVTLTIVAGRLFFKEPLQRPQQIGLILACISLILLHGGAR